MPCKHLLLMAAVQGKSFLEIIDERWIVRP